MRRQKIVLAALVLLAGLSPALGQSVLNEPERGADSQAAVDMGFEIVRMEDGFGSETRALIDRTIVAPTMEHLAPGRSYGFKYHIRDLDADGLDDLVVFLKVSGVEPAPDFDGVPVLVYLADENGWRLALEAGATVLAVKQNETGSFDLGLVQEQGVLVYTHVDGRYQAL